jgi:hypothetical protein
MNGPALQPILSDLVKEGQVLQGDLLPGNSAVQYAWAARWEREAQLRTSHAQQSLRSALDAVERIPNHELDVESEPSRAFSNYVLREYQPPRDKRYLVFLQCSVRRPFSTAPSHAAMRRAIRVATGYDPSPRLDFEGCPVHVVVVASKVGPVPYELEDLYPANVRGSGVKQFDWRRYQRVKPILTERIAQYVLSFQEHYERVTTFTEGRYAEVMEAARDWIVAQAGESAWFPILPKIGGTSIIRIGRSTPHQYWARYWIQLYLEIVSWLGPEQQQQAETRLAKLKVECRGA